MTRRSDPEASGRVEVWIAIADLWLDTEPVPVEAVARVLAASVFRLDELEAIYRTGWRRSCG